MTWFGFKMFLRSMFVEEPDECDMCHALHAPSECCHICGLARLQGSMSEAAFTRMNAEAYYFLEIIDNLGWELAEVY